MKLSRIRAGVYRTVDDRYEVRRVANRRQARWVVTELEPAAGKSAVGYPRVVLSVATLRRCRAYLEGRL